MNLALAEGILDGLGDERMSARLDRQPGRCAAWRSTSSDRAVTTARGDVVVIGGGAMGGAVAVHLLEDPAFDGRVTVIERDPTFAVPPRR